LLAVRMASKLAGYTNAFTEVRRCESAPELFWRHSFAGFTRRSRRSCHLSAPNLPGSGSWGILGHRRTARSCTVNPQESPPERSKIQPDPRAVVHVQLRHPQPADDQRPESTSFLWLDDHVEEPERWDGMS